MVTGAFPPNPEPQGQTDANLQTVPFSEYQSLKGKYDGLNGFVTSLKQQVADLQGEKAALVREYEGNLATARSERELALGELNSLKPLHEQATAELNATKASLAVSRKIAAEYPALAELHAEGLLRTDGMDDTALTDYLTKMNTKLGAVKTAGATDYQAGATPPTPQGNSLTEPTADELSDQLMNMSPDDPKYAATEAAFYAAVNKKR